MTIDLSQIMQRTEKAVSSFTDKAANSVNAETTSALSHSANSGGELQQTFNHLTTNLTQSLSSFNEVTEKLKTSALETASGAASTVIEAKNQATISVTETAGQAKGVWNQATTAAAQKLNDATTSMTETAEKTKAALETTVQQAGQLREVLSSSAQDLVVTSTEGWVEDHPTMSWLVVHPLWTVGLLLLTLFLTWSLLGAIAQLIQHAFLSLLQAPLKLMRSLFKGVFQLFLFKRTDASQAAPLNSQQTMQQRLIEILNRLESLRQEQDALMKEMHTLLISKS
jgi:uncharacterized protein YqgV (UPF0045/DUF77 family)